jgi:hypothetical protein
MLRIAPLLAIMLLVTLGGESRTIPAARARISIDTAPADGGSSATLFAFDDHSIPFWQNLYLKMNAATKHPDNPVLRRGRPGEPDSFGALFYGSILRRGNTLRMWYIAYDEESLRALEKRSIYGWRAAYAESTDGIHWVKPSLDLVEFHGSRNNNLVGIDPPDLFGEHLVVLEEPDDPDPSRRYKMMMTTRWDDSWTSVPLYSADGLRWKLGLRTKLENYTLPKDDAVLPTTFLEQCGFYKWRGLYHLTGHQVSPHVWLRNGDSTGRVMSIFRSRDLLHWSDTSSLAYVRHGYRSAPLNKAEEAHIPASVWNRGNVLLGTFGLFHGAPDRADHPIDLGLLLSNDGIRFREPEPNFSLIARGWDRPASWDSAAIIQAQAFENIGDRTFLWYGGWDNDVTKVEGHSEIGLATLPRDRFGALAVKTADKPAGFVTAPIRIEGSAGLRVNADGLSDQARLRVELLDEVENPIPGYSGESAAVVQQSGFDREAAWRGQTRITGLVGSVKIQVRFEGSAAAAIKLYALYLGE